MVCDAQAFAATHDGQTTRTCSVQLAKGLRDRAGEDNVASRLLLHALCSASLPPGHPPVDLKLEPREQAEGSRQQGWDDPVTEHLQAGRTLSGRALMTALHERHQASHSGAQPAHSMSSALALLTIMQGSASSIALMACVVAAHAEPCGSCCALNNIAAELQVSEERIDDPLAEVLAGRLRTVEYSGGQVVVDAPRQGRIYLPGSFNPLHDGHR